MKKNLSYYNPARLICFICLSLSPLFCFFGCTEQKKLSDYVSELRYDVFEGSSDSYSLKAAYGFKENPSANDGVIKDKIYSLTFLLDGEKTDDSAIKLRFTLNETEYSADFTVNPLTDSVTASVEIEDFNLNQFSVFIARGAKTEEVLLKSVVPQNTVTSEKALEYLEQNQSALLSRYKNSNGEFVGEIIERIIIKNEKPYWYVGLLDGKGGTKALLINGVTGEILAVREIF